MYMRPKTNLSSPKALGIGGGFGATTSLMESTNIHTFDISIPGETAYAGSGRVDGTILDQFSISEYQGVIR